MESGWTILVTVKWVDQSFDWEEVGVILMIVKLVVISGNWEVGRSFW